MTDIPIPEPAPLAYFDPGDGRKIAYKLRPNDPRVQGGPTLVFLPGYASDMDGTKALAIDAFAAAAGLAYLRFDYSGTGSSGGDFADGTLVRWLDEVVALIDLLVEGPVLLVGSSMGGWLALHAALKRPDRVGGDRRDRRRARLHRLGLHPRRAPVPAHDFAVRAAQCRRRPAAGDPRAVRRIGRGVADAASARSRSMPGAADPRRQGRGGAGRGAVQTARLDPFSRCPADIIKWGGHRLSEPHEIEAIIRTIAILAERLS